MLQHAPCYTPHYSAKNDQSALNALIEAIRAGHAWHTDFALRYFLHTFSLNQVPDVMYGTEVPFELRKIWRLIGIDPESANEVFEYLVRQGHEPSELEDWNGETHESGYRFKPK
ncbi:MAG: hypothetical protein JSR17_00685 [Proteobacteria bacterium]|nr:hypothetical protein [Pseudomonadota bacterium]